MKRLHRIVAKIKNSELADAFDKIGNSDFSDDFPLFEHSHCSKLFDKNIIRAVLYQRSKEQYLHMLRASRMQEIRHLNNVLLPSSFQLVGSELTINKIEL
jgi:hypothetical protein